VLCTRTGGACFDVVRVDGVDGQVACADRRHTATECENSGVTVTRRVELVAELEVSGIGPRMGGRISEAVMGGGGDRLRAGRCAHRDVHEIPVTVHQLGELDWDPLRRGRQNAVTYRRYLWDSRNDWILHYNGPMRHAWVFNT
jgi:hypothetical protein